MKKIKLLSVGADVEVFLQDKTTKEIISAEGFIKGTKDVPFVFDNSNPYFATSLDNVLAEFCIPPSHSKEEFYAYLKKSLSFIDTSIPKEFCTAILPSAVLDGRFLQTEQAKVFGCEPDFNAYTRQINTKPHCDNPALRSAGGHIHIGYEGALPYNSKPEEFVPDDDRVTIIKALDLFISIPNVITEPDNDRKLLYGCAGAFRPKSYGVEYRTVSNHYLTSKEKTEWIYESVEKAIDFINNDGMSLDLDYVVRNTINKNDKETANQLISHFNLKIAA